MLLERDARRRGEGGVAARGKKQSRALRAGRPPPARGRLGCQGPRARQLPPLARPRHHRLDALLIKNALTRLRLWQGPYRCPLGVMASWHSHSWQDLPKPYGAERPGAVQIGHHLLQRGCPGPRPGGLNTSGDGDPTTALRGLRQGWGTAGREALPDAAGPGCTPKTQRRSPPGERRVAPRAPLTASKVFSEGLCQTIVARRLCSRAKRDRVLLP